MIILFILFVVFVVVGIMGSMLGDAVELAQRDAGKRRAERAKLGLR